MARFYQCAHCGKIVGIVKEGPSATFCCGSEMLCLGPKASGEGEAKHVPVVKEEDGLITVAVGETPHPMLADHMIDWVYLLTDKGAQRKTLKPGDLPVVQFHVASSEVVLEVYAHCNLHGLWKANL